MKFVIMTLMILIPSISEAQQIIYFVPTQTQSQHLPANRGMHALPKRTYVPAIRNKRPRTSYRRAPVGRPGQIQTNPFLQSKKQSEVKLKLETPAKHYADWKLILSWSH